MIRGLMLQFGVAFVNFHVEKSPSIFRNTQGGRLYCLAVSAFFQLVVCSCYLRPWRTRSKFIIMVARESFCPYTFFLLL
jgi:hypothetical protein